MPNEKTNPIHRIYCNNVISQFTGFHGGDFMKRNEVKSFYKETNHSDNEDRKSNFNRLLITVINCELSNSAAMPVRQMQQTSLVARGGALYR